MQKPQGNVQVNAQAEDHVKLKLQANVQVKPQAQSQLQVQGQFKPQVQPALQTLPPGVALLNLGCRVNRVELDVIASELEAEGLRLCEARDAEAIVVNTCAVTGEAEAKTRKMLRKAAHLSQRPVVLATGCVASLFASELEALAPNIVVEPKKGQVAKRVLAELGIAPDGLGCSDDMLLRFASGTPTPTGRTRPGIKIQDGCDNRCTFCIVWKARGPARSLAPHVVRQQVEQAIAQGAREVVLTGINLGSYNALGDGPSLGAHDASDASSKSCVVQARSQVPLHSSKHVRYTLARLLDELLTTTSIERIRLSSIEPPDVTPELCRVIAESNGRIAPFLHICLQSGSNKTLRAMQRIYTTEQFCSFVDTARKHCPEIALGTDIIVGFPGETAEDFETSLAFCKKIHFAKMHVFRYSKRPGTPAARYAEQIDPQEIAHRAAVMRDLAQRMRSEIAQKRIGAIELALVQQRGKAISGGLFDVEVPITYDRDELLRVRIVDVKQPALLVGEPL